MLSRAKLVFPLFLAPPIPKGDFNGHLFLDESQRASREDTLVASLDADLRSNGFARRPLSARPYTYRNGALLSTIDYSYTRAAELRDFKVAEYVSL
jgi:hypothetical protein